MNFPSLSFLALFGTSALLVGFLTPKLRQFALRKEIFDAPNSAHKTHHEPVPYLGGVAIALGVVVVSLTATYVADPNLISLASGIIVPPLFLAAVGLVDDLKNLDPLSRLIAQSLVGITVALIVIQSDTVGAPTGSRSLDLAITVLFIVCLSNSINFFDNVDGGAPGNVAISTIFLFFLAFFSDQFYIAAISIVIAGATTGFLWWNKSPARIYMGDAGPLFLGSLLTSILVRFEPNSTSFPNYFLVTLFLVAIPLLDTCTVIISRISSGISPFKGGRDHLSHRMLRMGIPKLRAVSILWGLTTVFGILAVILSTVSAKVEPFVSMFGSALWFVLLFYFLHLPASESKMTRQ